MLSIGTSTFGVGTPGCLGRVSLGAVEPAQLGNADFRLLANHLPPNSMGWFLLGTSSNVPGSDPFGVGALLQINPLPVLSLIPSQADASGQADQAFPIPLNGQLVGFPFYLQVVHSGAAALGQDCSASPLPLVSSRGLTLSVQP